MSPVELRLELRAKRFNLNRGSYLDILLKVMTVIEISKFLGISTVSLYDLILKYDLELPGKRTIDWTLAYRDGTKRVCEIARETGHTRAYIYSLVRRGQVVPAPLKKKRKSSCLE